MNRKSAYYVSSEQDDNYQQEKASINPPNAVQNLITQVSRDTPPPAIRTRPPQPSTPPPSYPSTSYYSSSSSSSSSNLTNENNKNNKNNNASTVTKSTSGFSFWFCCGSKKNSVQAPSQISLVPAKTLDITSPSPYTSNLRGPPKKKLLALDLDETLVHSSFQPVQNSSFVISVYIEGVNYNVYVYKRPGVDMFLERLSKYYELIIYTASLSKYADPLLDVLDPNKYISRRLFREHCEYYQGHYVKNLISFNTDLSQVILVDNSPMSFMFQPENAIDCTSFFDDLRDTELWEICEFLISIKDVDDVRSHCTYWRDWVRKNYSGHGIIHGGSGVISHDSFNTVE